MSKPFFYRITAADYLAAIVTVPEADRGQWALNLALDMVSGDVDTARSEFAKSIIVEAKEFSEKKREAANKRWSKQHKQPIAADMQTDAVHSTAMPEAVTESEAVTEEQQPQPAADDNQFYNMRELSALASRYLGWNGALSPGQAEQLRPLVSIFKADVDYGFNAAAGSNAKSAAYVIKASGSNKQKSENIEQTEAETEADIEFQAEHKRQQQEFS